MSSRFLVVVAVLAGACSGPAMQQAGGGAASSGGGSAASGGGNASSGGGSASSGGGSAASGGGSAASGGGSAASGGGSAAVGGGSAATGGGTAAMGGGTAATGGGTADAGVTFASCFASAYVHPTAGVGPNYDQFHPVIGSHCAGTNHQNITGVQRVVFVGDSITVGTPPTDFDPNAVYRAILAKKLATKFGLTPPGLGWGGADYVNGVALPAESGDFVSCAKWGARTDDLNSDNHQITDCIPPSKRNLHHLVIMTMGGNDIDAITKAGGGTMPTENATQLQADAQSMVDDLRNAIVWMKDPANVPGGVDVVFSNNYEFTDGTGDVNSCPAAGLAGIQPWTDHDAQVSLVVWTEEQYMKIAVDTQTDMIFLLEDFCGHGYHRNDTTALCYRGPNEKLFFDDTCIHPNVDGHAELADLFYKTIAE